MLAPVLVSVSRCSCTGCEGDGHRRWWMHHPAIWRIDRAIGRWNLVAKRIVVDLVLPLPDDILARSTSGPQSTARGRSLTAALDVIDRNSFGPSLSTSRRLEIALGPKTLTGSRRPLTMHPSVSRATYVGRRGEHIRRCYRWNISRIKNLWTAQPVAFVTDVTSTDCSQ